MTWLQRRPSGQYRVRLVIPPRLRSFFDGRTILTKVLGTADPQPAKKKAVRVVADFQRQLQEAEAALSNPAVTAYRVVQDVQHLDERQAEALDSYLTSRMEEGHPDSALYRAVVNRNNGASSLPLSLLFERWARETRPTPKTAFEWKKIKERFMALALGGVDYRCRRSNGRTLQQQNGTTVWTGLLSCCVARRGKADSLQLEYRSAGGWSIRARGDS